ncbi:MAG: hypothetical protein R3C60_12535 [Parvularculaceae bacterium]
MAKTRERSKAFRQATPTIRSVEAMAIADLLRNDPASACDNNQRIAGALDDVEA